MQRAGQHPPIAAVVPWSCSHQYTGAEQVRVAVGEHNGCGPPRTLHQGGQLDTGGNGALVPAFRLFGS
jgi:hypothetical protein